MKKAGIIGVAVLVVAALAYLLARLLGARKPAIGSIAPGTVPAVPTGALVIGSIAPGTVPAVPTGALVIPTQIESRITVDTDGTPRNLSLPSPYNKYPVTDLTGAPGERTGYYMYNYVGYNYILAIKLNTTDTAATAYIDSIRAHDLKWLINPAGKIIQGSF